MTPPEIPAGLRMFARYAFPPNERGHCGPDDRGKALRTAAGSAFEDIARLARSFTGAWPYLDFIASESASPDPLDLAVVEAYWLGCDLAARVDLAASASALTSRLGAQAGWSLDHLDGAIAAGAAPHHGFHVFEVYPWVGLLDTDRPEALQILDQCRIRWGEVLSVDTERAVVRSRPLVWSNRQLRLGSRRSEEVRLEQDELGLSVKPKPGEWVSLHWDWLCDRLNPERLATLCVMTRRQLEITNRRF